MGEGDKEGDDCSQHVVAAGEEGWCCPGMDASTWFDRHGGLVAVPAGTGSLVPVGRWDDDIRSLPRNRPHACALLLGYYRFIACLSTTPYLAHEYLRLCLCLCLPSKRGRGTHRDLMRQAQ